MASFGREIVCLLLVLLGSAVPSLASFCWTVGESRGWRPGVDYNAWASGKNFVVGDVLVFNYESGYAVYEVSGGKYQTCDTSDYMFADANGTTNYFLMTTGPHFFISYGNCGAGMKLAVNVTYLGPSTPPLCSASVPTTVTPLHGPRSASGKILSPNIVAMLVTCLALFKFVLS